MFLGISMDIFSYLLAGGVLVLFFYTLLHATLYSFSEKVRAKTHSYSYFFYMKIIGVLATLATIGVLVYQFGYLLAVCEMCWWQRIFMFPIEIVALTALLKKMHGAHLTTMILSAFGIFFAGYHYWMHFKAYVLNVEVSSSCSVGGLLPSCTDATGVVSFGFVTIPLMALLVFISIFWLSFVAGRAKTTATK